MSIASTTSLRVWRAPVLPALAAAAFLAACGENGGGGSGGRVTFSIGGTTTGMVAGAHTPLSLKFTPDSSGQTAQTLEISTNGAWAFSPVPAGGGTLAVTAQPSALDQTCLLSAGSAEDGRTPQAVTSLTLKVGTDPVSNLQITCHLTAGYGASAVLSGLPTASVAGNDIAAYNVILYLTVTDIYGAQQVGKMVPSGQTPKNNVAFPFLCGTDPCQFADGSTYEASIQQPTISNGLRPEHCVLSSRNARGVITEADIQVQVQCSPVSRFLYVAGGDESKAGTVTPFKIDPKSGALTQNGAAVATGTLPGALAVRPLDAAIDPNDPPSSPAFAYLANYDSSTLSAYSISYSTGTIAALNPATVATPGGPWFQGGVPLPFAGNVLYVTTYGAHEVQPYRIDTGSGALTALTPLPTGSQPWGNVTLTPDGRFGYQMGFSSDTYQVFSLDASTGELTQQGDAISLPAPLWMTTDPEGRFAYIVSYTAPETDLRSFSIDPATGALTQIGTVSFDAGTALGTYLYAPPFIDPSGTYLFLLNDNDNIISVFLIHDDGTLSSAPGSPFQPGYWLKPANLVFNPGGRFAYGLAQDTSNIAAYAVNPTPANGEPALTLVGVYPTGGTVHPLGAQVLGSNPADMVIEPSGRFLYVSNVVSGTVSAFFIDANTGALSAVVGSPFGMPAGSVVPRNLTVIQ